MFVPEIEGSRRFSETWENISFFFKHACFNTLILVSKRMYELEWKKKKTYIIIFINITCMHCQYKFLFVFQIFMHVLVCRLSVNKGICIHLSRKFAFSDTISIDFLKVSLKNQWQNLRHLLFSVVAWNQNKREMSVTSIRMSPAYRLEHWLLSWPWKLAVCSWQFAPESGIEFH